MVRDVKVTIDRAASVEVSTGFGYPLIFEGKATTAIPYTECSNLEDVIRVVGGIADDDNAEAVATKTATAKATNIYKAASLMLMQDGAPSKIAVCGTTTAATAGLATILHHDWRQLVVVSTDEEGEDSKAAIAEFINNAEVEKAYFTSVKDVSEQTGDTAVTEERAIVMCHNDSAGAVFPEAALVGATAGKVVGSLNYKNKPLKGLVPNMYTDTQLEAIHDAGCIAFVQCRGYGVTSSGCTASGSYIDILDIQDYAVQNIRNRTQLALISYDKIPYTNAGISILENICVDVLQEMAENGAILVSDNGVPVYSVSYKPRSETKSADRAARRYVEGNFSFTASGAIDDVDIHGTIEI